MREEGPTIPTYSVLTLKDTIYYDIGVYYT